MLSNNETNSNVVEIQQLQQNNTTLSSEDLLKHMQSLEKRIKSLEVTNRVILGLFIGTLAAAITVGAGFAIAAAPIIAGSIVGGILATAALAALGVTAYKYRAEIKAGFKYAAEKTVDGAKYTAGKVRDGAVHVRDSVKEAVSSVGRATREGTGTTLGKMGRSLSNLSESMSSLNAIPYSIGNEGQTVVLKTEEKTRNFNSVKEMFIKEVLEDKAVDNSVLIKKIFSELKGKILEKAYSVDGQSGFKKDQLINQLKQQVDFVNKLDAKKLQNLLSKDNNNLYEIFSDHHDEIKRIVGECKREYEFDQSVRRNNAKDVEERKASKSFSLPSFSLLRRKGSEQSNSLSRSNSLNSVRTDSTISSEAELLNPAEHKEVKAPSSFGDKVSSPFKSGKKSEKTSEVKYQVLSESDTSSRQVGESTFYVDTPTPIENTDKTATIGGRPSGKQSIPVAPPKPPRSPSIDSGRGSSGSSTPHGLDYLSCPDDLRNTSAKLQKQGYFGGQARQQATLTLREKQDYVVIDMEGYTDSIGYQSGSDSGRSSPTSFPPQGPFANKDGKVGTPEVPTRSASLTNLNELNASSQNSLSEEFGSNPIRADNEVWYDAVTTLPDKGTLTHSNSTDSGMGSGSSTPTRQGLPSKEQFDKELGEKLAKRRAVLDGVSLEPITQKVTTV